MKIKTLLVALSAASLLASCGGAKWKTYSYKRSFSAEEKAALILKAEAATLNKISKMESKETYLEKYELRSLNREIKSVAELYAKGEGYSEQVVKETSEEDGLIQKSENTIKTQFALFDEENHKYAQLAEESIDGSYDYEEMELPEGYEGAAASMMLAPLFTQLSTQATAVEDKKGNQFFIFSTETETYTPVEWEHATKLQYRRVRNQYAVYLNEDNSLKSMTSYMSIEQNFDKDEYGNGTFGFYKRNKVVLESKSEIKFTYGDRADGSAKLSGLRADAKDKYQLAGAPKLHLTAYKEDGTELVSTPLDPVYSKQTAFGKYHYAYQVEEMPHTYLTDEIASIKLKLTGSSRSNSKEDPVAIDMPVEIANYSTADPANSYADGAIKVNKHDLNLTFELDVEATAEGASLSNVSAAVYPYVDW
ncbi:MAG: hypothetical protein K6E11_02825 [Bacilli bacterium]|nr:hypothetical protein [Bacilli bacterium]